MYCSYKKKCFRYIVNSCLSLFMWQYDHLEQKEGKKMAHKSLQATKFMNIYCSVGVTSRYLMCRRPLTALIVCLGYL
jgi:hypothetical protein